MSAIRLGTRASLLATTQSQWVADRLQSALGREVELVEVTTDGDVSTRPLAQLGGTGVFVSALREALLDGRIDVAVHSLKDLPTQPADGITLAAVPEREDPRDAVVARDGLTLGELPVGSRVGTGSPRRAAQLHALGLGLEIAEIRGNVDTRIRKVGEGELRRRRARPRRTGPDRPARRGDRGARPPADAARARAGCAGGGDPRRRRPHGERSPCSTTRTPVRPSPPSEPCWPRSKADAAAPIGVLAEVVEGDDGEELWVRAVALSPDGTLSVRMSATGDPADAAGVGTRLASDMIADGADQLMETPHEQPVTDCERQDA